MYCCCVDVVALEGKLRGLLVASAEDPELWAQERTDEGELEDNGSRQLGGVWCVEALEASKKVESYETGREGLA
jgi:hypothetical protein